MLLDNAGVSRSSGATPDTVHTMAEDAAAFLGALGLTQVDLLGFPLGGFVAQVLAGRNPHLVRIILAGTGPEGGEGTANLPQVVAEGQQATPAEPRLFLFFDRTESSQRAGRAFITRQRRRTTERDHSCSQLVGP